jgi:hypothetical protein
MEQPIFSQAMLLLVLAAFTIEAVWQTLKMTWDREKHLVPDRIGALVVSILVAVAAGLDFYTLVGFTLKWPIIGVILTGILLSRGANFMHDILSFAAGLAGNVKSGTILGKNETTILNDYSEPLKCPYGPAPPAYERVIPPKVLGDDGKADTVTT